MNKTIKYGLYLLLISTLFALVVFCLNLNSGQDKLSGKLVFAATAEQGLALNKIKIINSTQETTLILKDNFWQVVEGNNYYANLSLTNSLLNAMNNSRFLSPLPPEPEAANELNLNDPRISKENTGTIIQTFVDDKLIDEVILGRKTENEQYIFAKKSHQDKIWLASNFYTLPQSRFSWFQQPLINYAPETIRSYKLITDDGDEASFSRPEKGKDFLREDGRNAHLKLFSEYFTYLIFSDVKKDTNFAPSMFPFHKKIQISLYSGLLTDLDLYTDETIYWAKIKIYSDPITTFQTKDYIKNNAFLYEGWYFNIAPDTGRILFNSLKIKDDAQQ